MVTNLEGPGEEQFQQLSYPQPSDWSGIQKKKDMDCHGSQSNSWVVVLFTSTSNAHARKFFEYEIVIVGVTFRTTEIKC